MTDPMIDPRRWYTTREIVRLQLLPILNSEFKTKRAIKVGLLKGNTIGKDQGKRYFVRGEDIIKFLAKWEAGDYHKA